MKIALLGYGRMGKEIEKVALQRDHDICVKIDIDNQQSFDSPEFKNADVAINFSIPESAYDNIFRCFNNNIPVVCGTTGWLDKYDEVCDYCRKNGKSFIFASNFSIGVNVFFNINKRLAAIMNRFTEYDIRMSETHHIHKLDAPSGTAITLAEGIINNVDRKENWVLEPNAKKTATDLPVEAIRRDSVPGIHDITYESAADIITISHSAKNRSGFALGSVIAAEYIKDKTGVFTMNDILEL